MLELIASKALRFALAEENSRVVTRYLRLSLINWAALESISERSDTHKIATE